MKKPAATPPKKPSMAKATAADVPEAPIPEKKADLPEPVTPRPKPTTRKAAPAAPVPATKANPAPTQAKPIQRLPPLALGQGRAVIDTTLNTMRDHIEAVVPGLESLDSSSKGKDFLSQSSIALLGELKLAAHSHLPVTVERKDRQDNLSLMIPFAGEVAYKLGANTHIANAGHTAVFLSGAARTVKTSVLSEVMVSLDKTRLIQTANTMLGLAADEAVDLWLYRDREISLQGTHQKFQIILKHVFGIVDVLGDANAHSLIGLDDLLYRNIIILLRPELFIAPDENDTHRRESRRLDHVCQYVLANLDKPIRLTELERLSGLSRRSLQYAFKQDYGLTPREWIREERLRRAHQQLSHPNPRDTVTSIAHSLGFFHLGEFAALYKARFGETPSTRLRKKFSVIARFR